MLDECGLLMAIALEEWQASADGICLRFVDPYGDAVFNQAQLPLLINELRASQAQQKSDERRTLLQRVGELVERADGQLHTYVKFIGD